MADPVKGSRPELAERIRQLDRMLAEERKRSEKLENAIRWALGYAVGGDSFRERQAGDPPYWWRRELRERSGLR